MYSLDVLQNEISPLQAIHSPEIDRHGIRCWLKRDDELYLSAIDKDLAFSGNKWRKLKYNLLFARAHGYKRLLSFGGAFSNHIAAVASAGKLFGFESIGVIRGEESARQNPTLQFAAHCGMRLVFIDRQSYRQKKDPAFFGKLLENYPGAYIIPEGGTNELALKGSAEIYPEILQQLGSAPDYLLLCCGTGGTAAGIITSMQMPTKLFGISVLKGDFHKKEIQQLLHPKEYFNWEIQTEYHHGGYAKFTPALLEFIHRFYDQFQIYLDPVYTGKLLFAFWQQMQNGFFPKGSNIVILHSGGLQGIHGFNERFGTQLPDPWPLS